jgi:hypothetical protein
MIFPSGSNYEAAPWGLDDGVAPWEAGMIPVPEPSIGLLLLFGATGLAGLTVMRGSDPEHPRSLPRERRLGADLPETRLMCLIWGLLVRRGLSGGTLKAACFT